ncbi:hypothetical protein J7K93_00050 [bacterium]|nr:hypothetical protein [bacterium]
MPDLITHSIFNHILGRAYNIKRNVNPFSGIVIFFYLGTILPDILTRPFYIVFPQTHDWIIFLHTPVAIIFFSILLVQFLQEGIRTSAFVNLIAGSYLHFLLDSLQKQVTGNNFWLFPFSWHNFGFGLFWASDYLRFLPLSLFILIVVELIIFLNNRKSTL